MCKRDAVKRVENYEQTLDHAGVSVATVAPALVCEACGETVHDALSVESRERQLTGALVAAGVPNAKAFKYVRKALDLRAADLAKLLDVTPESLSRWETGTREIPRYARAILATLWLERDARGELRGVLEKMTAA